MKKIQKLFTLVMLFITLFPNIVLAYSNKVILGGNNVGIKVNTKYVMIVGFYKVNDKFIASDIGLEIGDNILKVNDTIINNIDDMLNIINSSNNSNIKLTILRNNKELEYNLELVKDSNGIYKSGLYVKDTINGIGSLTYIDPESLIFGALGHDIVSKHSNKTVKIRDGIIFRSEVTGIKKGTKGKAGSKEAKLYTNELYGSIKGNTLSGIFGKYDKEIDNNNLIEIAKNSEIKLGKAQIRTVISNDTIKNYDIEIININQDDKTKNILFKVTDSELLEKTGGIIAGMSGSPIIQNNKLVGAVTHVVVDEPNKGFGIFITTMLEEGEKE